MQNTNLVSIPVAAKILGIKTQTARDWLWKNKFPVPTLKINGKRLVPAHLLQQYIDNLISSNPAIICQETHISIPSPETITIKPS